MAACGQPFARVDSKTARALIRCDGVRSQRLFPYRESGDKHQADADAEPQANFRAAH
jgi:hypothetical protein